MRYTVGIDGILAARDTQTQGSFLDTIYSFGYWVRRRRKALDLTQRETAERVGCALVTLKKIEADERRPSLQMAERLAAALELPAAELDPFLAAARGERAVDTLGPPPQPALHPSRNIIPSPTTTLIGRETEVGEVLTLLSRPDARLVSIVGPGGIGKTRLALAAAKAVGQQEPPRFPQGIVFIDLAAATSVAEMVQMVAATLNFEPGGQDSDTSSVVQQLGEYLRPRNCLLILDNLEQIDAVAGVVDHWLRHTAAARYLVTSRERLNLSEEHLVALSGLSGSPTPSADPARYPAGQLFLARAKRVSSGFAARRDEWHALAEICRIVDGMPLALELAASWVDTITLDEIAIELQRDRRILGSDMVDLPARHRSLEAVWSATWARLDPALQLSFARLCVFEGGFTRAAAEAVADASLSKLAQLTGRYIMTLDRGTGRYRIHELLRQFGLEQLGASAAAADIRNRHFGYYEELLAAELQRLRGPEQPATLMRLDGEQDNLRQAMRWGLRSPDHADRLAHLILNLNWYWRMRSRVREGRQWVDAALAQRGRAPDAEAALQFVAGHMSWMASDFVAARQHQQAALILLEESVTPSGDLQIAESRDELLAYVTMALGMTAFQSGHPDEAIRWYDRSSAIFRSLSDEWGTAFVMSQMGRVLQQLDNATKAHVVAAEALKSGHQLDDPFLLAIAYSNLAFMAIADGNVDRAAESARQASAYQRATGHMHSLGQTMMMLGRLARQQGDSAAAHHYVTEALEVFQEMGNETFADEAAALLAQMGRAKDESHGS